jgi:phosphoribosylaminoimidazole-succinocarboxamide synthase
MAKNVALEGKTKYIHPIDVLVELKDVVTWSNKFAEEMPGKGKLSLDTTVAMFRLLEAKGRDTVFQGEVGSTMYRARFSHMIPLEVVVRFRNEEKGSFRKRNPDVPAGLLPKPVVEFYLKTSGKVFNGVTLPDDDPLITSWNDEGVRVHHPGKAVEGQGTFIPLTVEGWSHGLVALFELLSTEALTDACIVRAGWASVGWHLGDVKLEYGFVITYLTSRPVSKLYLAEAPSNDEWRLRDSEGVERSKQNIRDGKPLKDAVDDYVIVARTAKTIRHK